MNHLLKTLLTYSTLSALGASTQAADTEITVWGIDEPDSGPLDVTTVNAQLHGDFYRRTDHDVAYSNEVIGQDEYGNNIYGLVPHYSNPRNIYEVTLPDDWLGRSISISWTGGESWTVFKPFVTDHAPISFVAGQGRNYSPEENPAPSTTYQGNNVLIGKWWDPPSKVLFTLNTWDTGDPAWPATGMDFIASSRDVFWRWLHPGPNPNRAEIAMYLDYSSRLTLRKRAAGSSSQCIVLDPQSSEISINGQPLLVNTHYGPSRSIAFGYRNVFQGSGQTVMGVYNVPVGNRDNPTDPASEVFVVGSGSYDVTDGEEERRNAFSVKRDGDTTIAGALVIGLGNTFGVGNTLGAQANASGQLVVGKYNDTRTDHDDRRTYDGPPNHTDHTRGSLIIGKGSSPNLRLNALRVAENGSVLIPEQGDISMETFTNGPTP